MSNPTAPQLPEFTPDGKRIEPIWRAVMNAVNTYIESERRFSDRYVLVQTIRKQIENQGA